MVDISFPTPVPDKWDPRRLNDIVYLLPLALEKALGDGWSVRNEWTREIMKAWSNNAPQYREKALFYSALDDGPEPHGYDAPSEMFIPDGNMYCRVRGPDGKIHVFRIWGEGGISHAREEVA